MGALLMGLLLRATGFFMSGILIFSAPPRFGSTFEPADEKNLKAQFSVISDTHIESMNVVRFGGLAKSLRDIKAGKARQDALVLLGDNTAAGKRFEYFMLYSLLSHYGGAKYILAAVGNHDLDGPVSRHNFYYRALARTNNKKPYYSKTINGYAMIVMGSEKQVPRGYAHISSAQIKWLDGQLKAAVKGGKPAFVFNHQPLNHTFPDGGWGGVGEQSQAIREVLRKYSNVFFFSGHVHTPASRLSIQKEGGVTYVDVPTLLSKAPAGIGYQVEVYGNRVLLRARNFRTGAWIDRNNYSIALK